MVQSPYLVIHEGVCQDLGGGDEEMGESFDFGFGIGDCGKERG
jgi:hypothetical protein